MVVSQGQAETSVDTPRIRDAFPLAFFPPGLSPGPLTPACAFLQFLQEDGRLSVSLLPAAASRLCVCSMPHKMETCPCPNLLLFSIESPGHRWRGGGRGTGGAGIFIVQSRDCGPREGRPVAISHHRAESTALRCWGFIWNFTKSLFPLRC